jgi:hypothetical protein
VGTFLRTCLGASLLLLALLASTACTHDYVLEARDTPVHVWITAPELATQGGTLSALVYVGGQKSVEGLITFEPGKPTVALPSVHVKAGTQPVSAVLFDGQVSVTESVSVEEECWVQILVRGKAASLRVTEQQPSPQGR